MAERLLLTMEGEDEPQPVLRAAFLRRRPPGMGGADRSRSGATTCSASFITETADGRERRTAKDVEEALGAAGRVAPR